MVDAAVRRVLMSKIDGAAYEFLEELASKNHHSLSERSMPRKAGRVLNLDPITSLEAKISNLSKQLSKLNVNSI